MKNISLSVFLSFPLTLKNQYKPIIVLFVMMSLCVLFKTNQPIVIIINEILFPSVISCMHLVRKHENNW